MIALATPFGTFVADAIKSTTQGLFDVNQNALNSTGLINIDGQEFESCNHDYEVVTTGDCSTGKTTTQTCKLCGKTSTETLPAGHTWDDTGLTCTVCGTTVVEYAFKASDYDAKMGTTTATDANVVIPETFEYDGKTYKVTSIGERAFQNCTSLISIEFPKDIASIGNFAFSGCSNLSSIEIPENIESLNAYTFYNCDALTSITIPDGVTIIYNSCFELCDSLVSVNIPESVTSIGGNAFRNCQKLTDLVIPSGVTSIGDMSFYGCSSLTTINIPEGITYVPQAFGSSGLTSITFHENITGIAKGAFHGCYKLKSVIFESTEGWYVTTREGATSGTNIDVTSEYIYASLCTNYAECYWYRTIE